MENLLDTPRCAFQFFMEDSIPTDKLEEMITLAYMYTDTIGPVIMVCTEKGYDFLVRNQLDEAYIDFGICDDEESAWGLITHLKETGQLQNEDVINNLKNCSENIFTLYSVYKAPNEIKKLIQDAIEKENAKNSI